MPDSDKWEPLDSLGPTGSTVARNIERLRKARGLAFTELASRLEKVGRAIPTLGLRKIESGGRRVDTDDLVALALALNVSPITLLIPPSDDNGVTVHVTSASAAVTVEEFWEWLTANRPLPAPSGAESEGDLWFGFVRNAWPAWRLRQVHALLQREFDRTGEYRNPTRPISPWFTDSDVERNLDGNDK
ncbi:helix-turn-helix domain-containing protein [Mycobacteroides abscessus]|uniref:helix-turn-helix domain-containing protein n=1 Tax=Mycobacteroides abscessus TaxID=36809 RepID=UPI0021081609|nr:helix-turn-helix transcriptional regulator [Mycobacteroides abscessus]